ncbi:MAG TPA: L-fuculose-phosphate aldolase [Burkholderiales bacterium]|nr:L-fuculose-phosphate aldolase [Burkholderiales bacterium]
MNESTLRRQIITTALAMNALGINRGKSGNVSARWQDGLLITPSGLPYEETKPSQIVFVDGSGDAYGKLTPSSEWRFHHDIYRSRADAQAVVHAHSSFATTLACLGTHIPAFHYMIAVAGGNDIRCAPYATFGTQQLSDHALAALKDRKACLLANHGMIALETSLQKALALAVEVEALCEQYWRALQIGRPNILPDDEMAVVLEKFRTYGKTVSKTPLPRRTRRH